MPHICGRPAAKRFRLQITINVIFGASRAAQSGASSPYESTAAAAIEPDRYMGIGDMLAPCRPAAGGPQVDRAAALLFSVSDIDLGGIRSSPLKAAKSIHEAVLQ